jgi:hypothetical protein
MLLKDITLVLAIWPHMHILLLREPHFLLPNLHNKISSAFSDT